MLFGPNILALLLLFSPSANTSTITTAPRATSTSNTASTETCEFRTINYITDTLPQQCLKSSWSSQNATAVKSAEAGDASATVTGTGTVEGAVNGTATLGDEKTSAGQDVPNSTGDAVVAGDAASSTISEAEAAATDAEIGELNDAEFLSFEEWKKQTLEKAGQANANIGGKKASDGKKRDSESFQNNLDTLGEEGEIDLDFAAFRSGGKEEASRNSETKAQGTQEAREVESKRTEQYRSKDAGITCKERFNYASFDAGATILKNHPGAKNAKTVLIENKDSYMLTECTVENKFIIIELSEDIWIDTVVLANYEFFSSMIRTFRVSVSDRYPVKIDKWKDVGTYEARNSREIQAFLVSNPQIWARYIRIEFLGHYGKEYYCPLSLVRVHGTRMLESWKESESNGEDDEQDEIEEIEAGPGESFIPDAVAEVVQIAEKLRAASEEMARTIEIPIVAKLVHNTTQDVASNSIQDAAMSPWEHAAISLFNQSTPERDPEELCLPSEAPKLEPVYTSIIDSAQNASAIAGQSSTASPVPASLNITAAVITSISLQNNSTTISASTTISESSSAMLSNTTNISSETPPPSQPTPPTPPTPKPQNTTTTPKNKTSSTSSAATPLPTIQESFFKAVSRRLNFLETNSTLSLLYIEEQSRHLREAFSKVEKRQLAKTTTFLDTLNHTVLEELRHFRQQYDEIWQSTVISLESQRDESRREILAISSRLNILADEVVFQKRMAIVQSVLLLLCLALVIFSRVSGGTNIDFPGLQSRARTFTGYPLESPLESPGGLGSPGDLGRERVDETPWLDVETRRMEDDEAPPTPGSVYSRSEEAAFTPPSGADELQAAAGNILNMVKETPPPPANTPAKPQVTTTATHSSPTPAYLSPTTSPQNRVPKKKKGFIRQRSNEFFDPSGFPELAQRDLPLSPSPSTFPEEPQMQFHDGADEAAEQRYAHLPSPPPDSFAELAVQPQSQSPPLPSHNQTQAHTSPPTQSSPPISPPRTDTYATTHSNSTTTSPRAHGHTRTPSFSIVRKPLPALPSDG